MNLKIFTLHPDIFSSFFSNSLIARGVAQGIIGYELINWRDKYGIGNYKAVDDRPYGGGTGMVLRPEPIIQALKAHGVNSGLAEPRLEPGEHVNFLPHNRAFFDSDHGFKNVTISLTPRGFPLTQQIAEWLSGFEQMSILCGRYEGFDARVSDHVDLEISIGDFVLNGGEVGAMCLIEAVSRLVPGFVTKEGSVQHDSFSSSLNEYREHQEFVIGKRRMEQGVAAPKHEFGLSSNPFDNDHWKSHILPKIEHPQYTRPQVYENQEVPAVLLEGDHKKIDAWRSTWWG